MRKVEITAAVTLLAASAWTAASQSRIVNRPSAPSAPARPTAAARASAKPRPSSDAQLEAVIRAKLAKSPKLGPEKLQVHVQGGVATFEGKTDVVQHKGTATRMAKTAGAVAVNNHIQVSDAAKEKASANLEKGRRRAQIKRDERSDTGPPRATARR